MTVSLNFNTMKASPSLCLGRIGEHNATDLEITWTNSDERIASYRVAFQTGGKSVLSDSFFSMPIEVALWQQLTLNPRMSIQIIAYDSEGDYIGKSEKFSGFYFAPSVQSNEAAADTDQHDIGAELSKVEATVADHEERIDALEVKTEIFEINGTKTGYEWFNLYKTAVLKYRGNEIFGAKYDSNTKIATFFFYEKSAFDEGIFYVSVDDLKRTAEDLNPQGDIHLHENKAVIDKFSFEDGKLLYDGEEIGGGGTITDVQDADGNSLVDDGVATIPSEVIEIYDNGTLKYTPTQIQQLRLTKELKYASFEFVYINQHTTSPSTYAIYYLRPDNVPNRPCLYRDIWTADGVLTETKKVAQFSDENFTTAEKNKLANLAAVATSNDYDDLDNKPTIPVQGTITSGSTGYATGGDVYNAIQGGGVPSGTNSGDMLVWDGDEWVSKPKWQMIYQPVEYIESTGTQRIDTGLTGVDGIAIDLQNTSLADGYGIFGVCSSNNNTRYDLYYWSGLYFCTSNNNSSTNTLIDNLLTRSTLSHGVTDSVLRINEVEIATLVQTTSPTNLNFNLFARAGVSGGTEYKYGKARIYSCDLYIDRNLVRNYIPVRNIFTGEGGLYDLANDKFYGNKGTGDFVIGADVN